MGTDTHSGPLGEFRGTSTAGGGTALSTSVPVYIPFLKGTQHLFVTPAVFATGVVAKVLFNPWLVVLKTTDNLATQPVDFSEYAQDGDTATDIDLSSMTTLANGGFLLVGSHLPFRGVSIDVDATMSGSNSPALTVAYWDGSAWTSTSATDNTSSGSKSMAQDGTVTWTVPTPWNATALTEIFDRAGPSVVPSLISTAPLSQYVGERLYWTRWVWNAALNDTSVTLNSMLAMNRSTAYGELLPNLIHERRIRRGVGGFGCVEALIDAGTGKLIVNCDSGNGGRFT